MMGKPISWTKRPNGITRTYYIYPPGGTLANLEAGQAVSVSAKEGHVLTMRITPLPPSQRGKGPATTMAAMPASPSNP